MDACPGGGLGTSTEAVDPLDPMVSGSKAVDPLDQWIDPLPAPIHPGVRRCRSWLIVLLSDRRHLQAPRVLPHLQYQASVRRWRRIIILLYCPSGGGDGRSSSCSQVLSHLQYQALLFILLPPAALHQQPRRRTPWTGAQDDRHHPDTPGDDHAQAHQCRSPS